MTIKPKAPKAIFFDLDGTLIDSAPDVLAAFAAAFDGLGAPCPPPEDLRKVIGLELGECFARFLPPEPDRVPEAVRLFRRHYRAHFMDATRPFPGVAKSVRELEARYLLGVATMKKGEYARQLVRAFGWLGIFNRVIGAEEGYPPKPDPTVLQALCRSLDIRPDEAVYVGDTELDVRMALAAKVPAYFASYGYGTLPGELSPRVAGVIQDSRTLWKELMDSWR